MKSELQPVNRWIPSTLMYHADLIAVRMEDDSYVVYKNILTEHRGDNIDPTLFRGILAQAKHPIVLHHAYVSKDEYGCVQFN